MQAVCCSTVIRANTWNTILLSGAQNGEHHQNCVGKGKPFQKYFTGDWMHHPSITINQGGIIIYNDFSQIILLLQQFIENIENHSKEHLIKKIKGPICNSQLLASNKQGAVFPPLLMFSSSPFLLFILRAVKQSKTKLIDYEFMINISNMYIISTMTRYEEEGGTWEQCHSHFPLFSQDFRLQL